MNFEQVLLKNTAHLFVLQEGSKILFERPEVPLVTQKWRTSSWRPRGFQWTILEWLIITLHQTCVGDLHHLHYYSHSESFFYIYSSLELPYVTPLEKQDKQRKTFTKTLANTGIHSVPKPRALSKSKCQISAFPPNFWISVNSRNHFETTFILSARVVSGKMGDDRPSPLGKFVVSGSMQELGHSSGSEGEKESPPPEWDIPLKTVSRKQWIWKHNLDSIMSQFVTLCTLI